jgi:glutaredoxin 3
MLIVVMTFPVVIYTTATCPYCIRAKKVLSAKSVDFQEIDVSNDPDTRKYLVEVTGQRTVPQIFIAGKSIGGCDDMIVLDRQGKLDDLLKEAFAATQT